MGSRAHLRGGFAIDHLVIQAAAKRCDADPRLLCGRKLFCPPLAHDHASRDTLCRRSFLARRQLELIHRFQLRLQIDDQGDSRPCRSK
jgi:hypothetical protein